mgnify:CR=1 FL=1
MENKNPIEEAAKHFGKSYEEVYHVLFEEYKTDSALLKQLLHEYVSGEAQRIAEIQEFASAFLSFLDLDAISAEETDLAEVLETEKDSTN